MCFTGRQIADGQWVIARESVKRKHDAVSLTMGHYQTYLPQTLLTDGFVLLILLT